MKTILNWKWKRGLFSDYCTIYDNDKQIGFIKRKSFSGHAIAEMNGKKYEFKGKRILFNPYTNIVDMNENKVVGTVEYSTLPYEAYIYVDGEISTLKYKKIWGSKNQWILYDSNILDGLDIFYNSSNRHIETDNKDEMKILSGLCLSITNSFFMDRIGATFLVICYAFIIIRLIISIL